ncbi:MAG: response regulator [Anaerolineae bacterium]|nr:response regulator [Anaerolineae bacterium]
MHALIVEDEPANQDFLVRLITQAGFEVHGAHDGAEALAFAREHPDLDLVVTDIQLPDISGLELAQQVREILPETLLVVATMWDEPSMIEQAFACGCDVFLVKPHGFMEMFMRLKGLPETRDQLTRLLIDQYGPRPYLG